MNPSSVKEDLLGFFFSRPGAKLLQLAEAKAKIRQTELKLEQLKK
jgi:hypothetical protein